MAPSPLPAVRLHLLGADVLQALIAKDLEGAGAAAGLPLPEEFLADTWLWTLRLGQLLGEPDHAPWLIRAIVAEEGPGAGAVVGHAGFHGTPDERGMVEVGYRVIPAYRGAGYARAALDALLTYARAHGVRVARASISPDNGPSRHITAAVGFVEVGEQTDEIDGRELIFELGLT
jgi:[ribosomal protein S5]-alanine N-acetyltransferase